MSKYIFRAINDRDLNNYINNNKINSQLLDNNKFKFKFESENFGFMLDCVIGHINGRILMANRSPWISFASFDKAANEFSIPQNGGYNYCNHRKVIIAVEKKEQEYNINDRLKNCKDINNYILDLSENGNLQDLADKRIILPMNYKLSADINCNTVIPNIIGFSNFASYVNESLIFKDIKKKDIVYIIGPFITDLIYALGNEDKIIDKIFHDLNKKESIIKFIVTKYRSKLDNFLGTIFDQMYDENSLFCTDMKNYENMKFQNLTDITCNLYESYNNSCNIQELYRRLKGYKRTVLAEIINGLNEWNFFNNEIHIAANNIKLVDDYVYVISEKSVKGNYPNYNDVLIYEDQDGKIFKSNGGKILLNNNELEITKTPKVFKKK